MNSDKLKRTRRKVIKINRRLLESGMDLDAIMIFWEDCMAEAEIQYNLPPCNCKDVNHCDAWCQAKARFAMNPPK